MIITAMYIYGISQHAWGFSWFYGLIAFVMDMMLAIIIAPNINVMNKTSSEEAYYWEKRAQVEELNRIKLDRELYGGKR